MSMKCFNKIVLYVFSMTCAACVDEYNVTVGIPDKPTDVATQEYLNSYDVLKSYIVRDENSPFELATFVFPVDFQAQKLAYSTILENFDAIDLHGAFIPVNMQDDSGAYDFSEINAIGNIAHNAGVTVYGGILYSNQGQPATYLNKLIEPDIIHIESDIVQTVVADFENEEIGKEYMSVQKDPAKKYNTRVDSDPVDASNKVLYIGPNGDDYSHDYYLPIIKVKLPDGKKLGEYQNLSFDAFFNVGSSVGQFRIYFYDADGKRYQFNLETANSMIEGRKEVWVRNININLQSESLTSIPYGLVLPKQMYDLNEFEMALGLATYAADLFIDNISFSYLKCQENIVADFEDYDIDKEYPCLRNNNDVSTGFSNVKIVSDPNDNKNVLQVGDGTDVRERVFPIFDVELPYGKTLGDIDAFVFDICNKGLASWNGIEFCILPPGYKYENKDSYKYHYWDTDNYSVGKLLGGIKEQWVRGVKINIPGKSANFPDFPNELKALTKFQIAFGFTTNAPNFYLDNFKLIWEGKSESAEQIVEKTPEQKKNILVPELKKWITGMVEAGNGNITMWDVVSEPLNVQNDENTFYWKRYLGEQEYARMAVKMARETSKDELKLYVAQTFIQGVDKISTIEELTALVSSWEDNTDDSANATVIDGYNIRLTALCSEDIELQANNEQEIVELFTKLAATQKPIRLSNLGVMLEDEKGNFIQAGKILSAQSERAADYLAFVIKQYRQLIALENQCGISIANMTTMENSCILCPWTSGFGRTEMYEGIVNGLKSVKLK